LGDTDLTMLEQHSARADLRTTQDIRDALQADASLSRAAKNIKIVTRDGSVTLSGTVQSDDERRTIDLAARRIAGALKVDNRIEVTP
jgi:osmotically-inducible protein OsmY